VSVNGGPPQVQAFQPSLDWSHARAHFMTLDGFRAGANTVTFTVPADGSGPDLDWIQVVPEAP
jgi:hypothetical protein